jgi:hypothetical protein
MIRMVNVVDVLCICLVVVDIFLTNQMIHFGSARRSTIQKKYRDRLIIAKFDYQQNQNQRIYITSVEVRIYRGLEMKVTKWKVFERLLVLKDKQLKDSFIWFGSNFWRTSQRCLTWFKKNSRQAHTCEWVDCIDGMLLHCRCFFPTPLPSPDVCGWSNVCTFIDPLVVASCNRKKTIDFRW